MAATAAARLAGSLMLIALALMPRVASADPEPDRDEADPASIQSNASEARRLYEQGLARYSAGEYARAIEFFNAAHVLFPAPGFLYNVAQAERLSGHCEQAVAQYGAFLKSNPHGRIREYAEAWLRELEPCPTTSATLPTGASSRATPAVVRPPQPAPRSPPPPQPVRTPRPRPRPVPRFGPFVDASRPTDPARSQTSPNKTLRLALSIGSAVALFSAAGYFGWRAERASDRVSRVFESGGEWTHSNAAAERAGERDAKFALAGVAGGILASGVSVWFLTFD